VSELPGLNEVRVKYGPAVDIIDLSSRGALVEVPGYRLQPGATVVMEIAVDGTELVVPAQVLRSHVVRFAPQPVYRGGLAFKRPIPLPGTSTNGSAAPEIALAREFERMTRALERRPGAQTTALAALLALLDAPAARRAGAPFASEAARLLRFVTVGLDRKLPSEPLVQRLLEHLHKIVPAQIVRIVEGTGLDRVVAHAPVFFDVSAQDGPVARLLIDFSRDSRIDEWHFHYLKVAAQLLTLVRHLDAPAPLPAAAGDERVRAIDAELPDGWHKLVVRYIDGRMLKGYSQEFTASSASLHVWPSLASEASERITVPLAHLKAVFFVRDFEGNPERRDDSSQASRTHGRRVAVTFLDGEVIVGTTLNYSAEAIGFFIRPVDDSSNNVRVFVAAGAIRQVRFP
jgi:hypothetical protein